MSLVALDTVSPDSRQAGDRSLKLLYLLEFMMSIILITLVDHMLFKEFI